jgi:hypothetical protein
MFSTRIRTAVRQQWAGLIALFLALSGGVAWASHPGGANTINSADIIDGQVKEADVGQGAVASSEVKNDSIRNGDVAPNSLTSGRIADGTLTGADVQNNALTGSDIAPNSIPSGRITDDSLTGADVKQNSLKGADIDEATLDVGDAARAYARVDPGSCTGTPGTCTAEESKGISSVIRDATGFYCVTAPGIDANVTPAAATVDWASTPEPEGNASAMTVEVAGCGPDGEGFTVITDRQPNVTVDSGGGVNNATVAGPANFSNDVSFTIVIP